MIHRTEPDPSAPDTGQDRRIEWVTQAAVRYALGHSNLGEFIDEVVEIVPSTPAIPDEHTGRTP